MIFATNIGNVKFEIERQEWGIQVLVNGKPTVEIDVYHLMGIKKKDTREGQIMLLLGGSKDVPACVMYIGNSAIDMIPINKMETGRNCGTDYITIEK